jgi:hypothetical protein
MPYFGIVSVECHGLYCVSWKSVGGVSREFVRCHGTASDVTGLHPSKSSSNFTKPLQKIPVA